MIVFIALVKASEAVETAELLKCCCADREQCSASIFETAAIINKMFYLF